MPRHNGLHGRRGYGGTNWQKPRPGHYSNQSPSFAEACKQVDSEIMEKLGNDAAPKQIRSTVADTPQPLIEALIFQLRSGLRALDDPSAQRRLLECDETALQEICGRVQKLNPKIFDEIGCSARAWTPDEVKQLVQIRATMIAKRDHI
jgi:hypothetical protein